MTVYRAAMLQARAEDKSSPRIPEYVGKCLMMIAERLSRKPNFSGYSYRDEMVSDAIENCIMYGVNNFDPAKTNNPFAYFTQIIKFAFFRRIEKESKQQYIKIKNMEHRYLEGEMFDGDHDHGTQSVGGKQGSSRPTQAFDNEITAEFVRHFEEKEARRKRTKKEGI